MNKSNPMTISTLSPAEFESTCSVFETSIQDAFEKEGLDHLQDDIQSEIDHKKQMVMTSLDTTTGEPYFLLAKIEEQVVGTISFGPCGEDIQTCTDHQLDEIGELGSLYIMPSYQGQGVGSALIKEMMIFLKKQGVEQFCLDSGYKHAQVRWQRKFGQPYKVVEDYWGPDSVHMVWFCNVNDHLS
ncbi:GNAT family N-acetyltransferase [Paenibacillus sp. FSL H3-0310]|uniref:GNAT family N-acetyltransferase n=1 Tax=Paenibacillus sp. FSL H3-0310 TaxID=2921429 RepID=UPI0030F5E5CB